MSVKCCPKCGVVVSNASKCPYCHCILESYSSVSANWSDSSKSFFLEASLDKFADDTLLDSIAQKSNCSCGTSLAVGDHKIEIRGSDCNIAAVFYCPRCNSGPVKIAKDVLNSVCRLWNDIEEISITSDGFYLKRKNEK